MTEQTNRAEHKLANLAYLQHLVDLKTGEANLAKKALKRTKECMDAEYAAEQLTYAKQALQLALLMLGPWQQDELPLTQPGNTNAASFLASADTLATHTTSNAELDLQMQNVGHIIQTVADQINAGALDGPGITATAQVRP